MISDFIDELVSQGAEAILPHNLPDKWFKPIYKASLNFIKEARKQKEIKPEDKVLNDMDSLLLITAVTEIISSRYDYPAKLQVENLPEEVLFESMASYSIYVIFEALSKEQGISYPKPDADTLLERERILDIEAGNPKISELLYKIFEDKAKKA